MTRRSIEIEGFRHANPIPAASRVGPLLASSVVAARDPGSDSTPDDAESQIANLFDHVDAILTHGGCRLAPCRADELLRARPRGARPDQRAVARALPRCRRRGQPGTPRCADQAAVSCEFIAYVDD